MTTLRAGFGRADITPKIGCKLVGYGNRSGGATGVHDRLSARALVLEDEGGQWALISVEFCYVKADSVREIRAAIQERLGIPPEKVFVATTHTHSGPHDRDKDNWKRPLAEFVADAVEAAQGALQPARIGSGYGMLYGYSINRRWIDRPVDPAVAVIRVDDEAGQPLGLVTNFACHAVVLGPDNLQISGDWPGDACRKLEAALGEGTTCLFFQSGAGNVNPLVDQVRRRLQSDHTVVAIGDVSAYYGDRDDPNCWNIGNRRGGTFEEVAELADAFVPEVLHIARNVRTKSPSTALWSQQLTVRAIAGEDEPRADLQGGSLSLIAEQPELIEEQGIPAEIMLVGIGDALLLGEPGEVFSETAVRLRTNLRLIGVRTPFLVTYANGWLAYLPEPEAFDEGGYEPGWANRLGISRYLQQRVWDAVQPAVRQHIQT